MGTLGDFPHRQDMGLASHSKLLPAGAHPKGCWSLGKLLPAETLACSANSAPHTLTGYTAVKADKETAQGSKVAEGASTHS